MKKIDKEFINIPFSRLKLLFILWTLSAIVMSSCNETPVSIPDFELPNTQRVVLFEYLTGVKCPNCPKGSAVIKNMLNIFPVKIAVVGIHGRLQTEPLKDSKYDFRTEVSRQLEEFHRPFLGKPSAMINRLQFAEEPFKAVDLADLWPSYVEGELKKPQLIDIALTSNYDKVTRKVSLALGFLPKVDLNGTFSVSIFVTENKIIDLQETIGRIIPDYEHEHVLRHMMTNVTGDDIASNLKKNQLISKVYSYAIPSEFYVENIDIIVAIRENSSGYIHQALLTKIK